MATTPLIQGSPRRIARLGDRVIASFLDLIAVLPVYVLIGFFIGVRTGNYEDGNVSLTGGPALELISLGILTWIAYHVTSEYGFNGSLGKRMMGIRVTSADYSTASFGQSVGRNVFRLLGFFGGNLVGFIAAVSSSKHQRLGDRVAGTIVIEEDTRRGYAVTLWVCWFVLASVGLLVLRYYLDRGLE
jgi:uncharacterized RDD family membrane protein YckC